MKLSFNKNKYKNKKNRNNEVGARKLIENRTIVSNPIQASNSDNSQIISGYFLNEKPYKELIIQRVNNFLCAVLGLLVIFCLTCYYFVSCKEVQLNKISRETLELNYENEELQNKVDSLQSYYNIDKAVTKSNILERAKHVVEVNAIDIPDLNIDEKAKKKQSFIISY